MPVSHERSELAVARWFSLFFQMNKQLLQLMEIQGEVKIRLMKSGLSQEKAHELAGDLLDYIARSPITTEEHRQAYAAIG